MTNYTNRLVSFTSNIFVWRNFKRRYLAVLYKAPRSIVTLNKLRYQHAYNTLVARQKGSAAFDLVALPPQVQLPNSTRIIYSNGWALTFKLTTGDGNFQATTFNPIPTEDSSAPPFLMKLVFCNYQGGCSASSCNKPYIPVVAINYFAFREFVFNIVTWTGLLLISLFNHDLKPF